MRKVVIDTDPGADDALALMMTLNSDALAVEGITTVGGNATLSETTRNALRLVEYFEREMRAGAGGTAVRIVTGADRPTHGAFSHAYHVHGPGGLGVDLPGPSSKPHGADAPRFIHDLVSASPGRVAVIALGPLTNIAAALERFPGLASEIEEIVVMGGALEVEGNITRYAEFNIYEDPWAANAVFTCGAPVTLVGLDVTHKTFLHRSDGPEWFPGGSASARLCNRIMASLLQGAEAPQVFHLHDPLALAAAIEPDALTYRQASVSVATDGEERGRTTAHFGRGTVKAAVGVDVPRALQLVRSAVSGEGAGRR